MQTCRKCGEAKPLSSYDFRNDNQKHRTECKNCRANSEAARRYGITVGDVEQLKAKQSNSCAICGIHAEDIVHATFTSNPLVIDHDHKTGQVRGLLCSKCNLVIGNADDSVEVLLNAVKYLAGSRG